MSSDLKNLSGYDPGSLPDADTFKIGLVVSEWNRAITEELLRGALDTLAGSGVREANMTLRWVPGSFELPLAASLMLDASDVDAVICLGCVIQGETRHFEFICQAVAAGITQVGLQYRRPAVFGVLTTDNLSQAIERSGGKHGNKGVEAAVAAIRMIALRRDLYTNF